MSPTSYRTALSRDIIFHRFYHWWLFKWRRKRDSNPCADFSTSRFSRPVPSTRLGYSSNYFGASDRTWTDMSFYTRRILSPVRLPIPPLRHLNMVSRWGFEPQTPWLKVKCSTGWASETNIIGCLGWIRTSGMQESKSCALPLGYEAKLQVVERGGFEPPNPKEQIYSLSRLASSLSLHKNGAENRNWTRNLLITSQLLYQLSYFGTWWRT